MPYLIFRDGRKKVLISGLVVPKGGIDPPYWQGPDYHPFNGSAVFNLWCGIAESTEENPFVPSADRKTVALLTLRGNCMREVGDKVRSALCQRRIGQVNGSRALSDACGDFLQ